MKFSDLDWHQRYLLQSTWTRSLRQYLFERVGIDSLGKILDVGCGTGVLEAELTQITRAAVFGVDVDASALLVAAQYTPQTTFMRADGHYLPFPVSTFDLVMCHFTLMWVESPALFLSEMIRVGRPGGSVLAIAEPDYGGRIDFPLALEKLGAWQAQSLRVQGADPILGRRLRSLFKQAGFSRIETGVLGGQWSMEALSSNRSAEWEVLEYDLAHLSISQVDASLLDDLKSIDAEAYRNGERVLFVPTFYAWGKIER